MADEPIDATQAILRNIQEGVASIKADTQDIRKNLTEVQVTVAALTLSNREIRADTAQLLAESGNHEKRIRRLEEHLGLIKA